MRCIDIYNNKRIKRLISFFLFFKIQFIHIYYQKSPKFSEQEKSTSKFRLFGRKIMSMIQTILLQLPSQ